MSQKPLPRGSGIGAAELELGSKCRRRCTPNENRVHTNCPFPAPASICSTWQSGPRLSQSSSVSNEMLTLATKPSLWANLVHPLPAGISAKMRGAECARAATAHCTSLRNDGWAP